MGFGDGVDFVLADLGVSSMQLDDPARGFSYKLDGPLDMRMNPARGPSAAEWLARVTPVDLAARLRDDADEPHAEAVAAALCAQSQGALRTTAAASATSAGSAELMFGTHSIICAINYLSSLFSLF